VNDGSIYKEYLWQELCKPQPGITIEGYRSYSRLRTYGLKGLWPLQGWDLKEGPGRRSRSFRRRRSHQAGPEL